MRIPVWVRCQLLGALTLAYSLSSAGAADPASDETAPLTPQQRLELFHKAGPAARLRLIERLPRSADEFHKVAIGNVTATLVERGTLEPAVASDLVCRIKAPGKGSTVATAIKWVVDDGTLVKAGERVIELDDSAIREQLAAQRLITEQAAAARLQAEEHIELLRKSNQADIRLGEIALRLAELDLRKAGGADRDRREALALQVEKAHLELERTKAQTRAKEKQAEADLRTRTAGALQEATRQSELEEQRKQCVLTAPHDGLAVYFIPEQTRAAPPGPIVAVGEPVREGQRLVRICDLRRMLVSTRIHEAIISRVRNGQKAVVRVDAFPTKSLAGTVTQIATVASQADWLNADMKVYRTSITLADEMPGLKPGMSAEVRVVLEERRGVVRVPIQAVVRLGRSPVCYVKTESGIEEHRVVAGVHDDLAIEIKEGLKEGDLVLRDPRALLLRLPLAPGKDDGAGTGRRKAAEIVVRSVKLSSDAGPRRRDFVSTYGLTHDDLERLRTVPGVTELIPLRTFPHEVRHLEKKSSSRVVATTPAFADDAGRLAAGRFLNDDDGAHLGNVAVVGSAVAEELFPEQGALGETIRLGSHFYMVVGILHEQVAGFAGLTAEDLNRSVYVPLPTAAARFGDRIILREAGSLRAEAVQLSAVVLRVDGAARGRGVAAEVRKLLEAAHKQKDWEVVTPDLP
jgi:multidrug efflux pump subunit AcrA (membrane-fusion protein)